MKRKSQVLVKAEKDYAKEETKSLNSKIHDNAHAQIHKKKREKKNKLTTDIIIGRTRLDSASEEYPSERQH